MRTLAAVAHSADAPFSVETVDIDDPRDDEILVQIVATGLCHTDLTFKAGLRAGSPGAVLGHEGAGIVLDVGAKVSDIHPGDHVVLSYRHCGRCGSCRTGHPTYCGDGSLLNFAGTRADGSATLHYEGKPLFGSFFGQSSFAAHALAAPDNVVVVGPDLDLTLAAPLGCGFQTGAGAVMNVLRPQPDSRLAVFGAGGVGLAAVMAARASDIDRVIAVDPVPSRRALALELGATAALDPTDDEFATALADLTDGGPTHALDATGRSTVTAEALRSLRPTGTLVVVGLGDRRATIDIRDVMLTGKTLRGCTEGDALPQEFIPKLIDLHAEGKFPIERLITEYDARDIGRAVVDMSTGTAVKPVLVW